MAGKTRNINITPGQYEGIENPAKVNLKQERFLQRYVANNYNIDDAEKYAGYAMGYGIRLLELDNVRRRLSEILKFTDENLKIYQRQVVDEIAALAFSDISDIGDVQTMADIRALPPRVRRTIQKVDYDLKAVFVNQGGKKIKVMRRMISKIHLHPKQQNLELLAKVTRLIENEHARQQEDKPTFTGLSLITSDQQAGQQKETESNEDNK